MAYPHDRPRRRSDLPSCLAPRSPYLFTGAIRASVPKLVGAGCTKRALKAADVSLRMHVQDEDWAAQLPSG